MNRLSGIDLCRFLVYHGADIEDSGEIYGKEDCRSAYYPTRKNG